MLALGPGNRQHPNRVIGKTCSCSVIREAYAILPIYTICSLVNLNRVICGYLFVFLRFIADPITNTINKIGVTEGDGVRDDRLNANRISLSINV